MDMEEISIRPVLWDSKLSDAAKVLYFAIIMWDYNGSCATGISRISKTLGKSPSAISMRLKELADGGYVTVKYRGQGRTAVIIASISP